MSFGSIWEIVDCKCGVRHYENFETLGFRRGRCSVCMLTDKILENEYEIVSLIKSILMNSKDVRHIIGENVDDLNESKIDEIVTNLCKKHNISDDIIEDGLSMSSHSMSEVKELLYRSGELSDKIELDLELYFKCTSIDQLMTQLTDGVNKRLDDKKSDEH